MELQLQFGHAMMEHTRTLISAWGGGTAILSPRDLKPGQLTNLAGDVQARGGSVLLDPQFYLPHADHTRLCSHAYWPAGYDTTLFWNGTALTDLITALRDLNQQLGARAFLLPGMLVAQVDADWLACQQAVVEAAAAVAPDSRRIMTVALGADAARNAAQVHAVLEASEGWDVHGYYLVCEHPRGQYLVDDPMWLAMTLDLAAGWRLRGKEVIIGYSSHQMLLASTSKATAIASGIWLNVRSFPPEKFQEPEEGMKKRSTWYYCPQSLSEYKLEYLDIAHAQGLLDRLAPDAALGSQHTDQLFSGPQPSSVGLSESDAFRHYLQCLHSQTAASVRATFDETVDAYNRLLDEAEALLGELRRAGVRGQLRDFSDAVDASRGALAVHTANRGVMLRRRWASL